MPPSAAHNNIKFRTHAPPSVDRIRFYAEPQAARVHEIQTKRPAPHASPSQTESEPGDSLAPGHKDQNSGKTLREILRDTHDTSKIAIAENKETRM